MITAVRALSPQNLGGLFTLSTGDIKNIKSRVSECIKGKHMATIIAKSLPSFPQAVDAAELWNSTLFMGIQNLCKDLAAYTDTAIHDFSELDKMASTIDPDKEETLPLLLRLKLIRVIANLKAYSNFFLAGYDRLNPGIIAFIAANNALDNDILTRKLAFKMNEIAANLNALGKANGLMRGEWQRLNNDLENLSKIEAADLNLSIIAKLELGIAVDGWKKLKAECDQFLRNNT